MAKAIADGTNESSPTKSLTPARVKEVQKFVLSDLAKIEETLIAQGRGMAEERRREVRKKWFKTGVTLNEMDRCPLCGTRVKILEIPPTLMQECDCPVCGVFSFSTYPFRQMRETHPDPWIMTKSDLSAALQKGVVKRRRFETVMDIQNALGDLNKTPKS